MNRILILIPVLIMTASCSIPSLDEVLSDKRTEYEKSRSLPPLDVPPDLAANEPNDAMTIPGETTSASLKDYQRNQQNRSAPAAEPVLQAESVPQVGNTVTVPSNPAAVVSANSDGPFVVVRGNKADIWAMLQTFMTRKGYRLDLDDYELGYMETHWSVPMSEGGLTYRYKLKVYSEQGAEPGTTVLYLDNERQEQLMQGNGNSFWVDRGKSPEVERVIAGEMNQFFNAGQQQIVQQQAAGSFTPAGSSPPVPGTTVVTSRMAEIQEIGDDKILLAIPEEYTRAWQRTGEALQRAGLIINDTDQERGLYRITYRSKEEDSGWTSKLKKLKFWGRDDKRAAVYQVALTGVGNKTELVLLDENGDWEDSAAAETILSMIQTQYNQL